MEKENIHAASSSAAVPQDTQRRFMQDAPTSVLEYCGIQMGGQLAQTTIVENFPGYPQGVDGNQMMMDLREQALRFGADIRDGSIAKADFSKAPYVLTTDSGHEIEADTVIIATGASAKYLGLDDEKKYNGRGVSACATCDGILLPQKGSGGSGRRRHRVRGGHLSGRSCKKVYMIVRKPFLRASDVMRKRGGQREDRNPLRGTTLWDSTATTAWKAHMS